MHRRESSTTRKRTKRKKMKRKRKKLFGQRL
jgi:hypothetical protein